MKNVKKTTHVSVFNLSDTESKLKYEKILNSNELTIVRREFAYDKLGQAIETIWYEED